MPSRVNGIGTWYCGKTNVRTHRDRCESCGAYADLRSYDTTLYFTVLFIPVIPLGGRRVINECPRCTRHRAAKLRQYQDARDKDILEALAAFKASPHDPEKARAAVGAALAYEAEQEFLTVAPVIEQAAPNSPGAQAAVAAGYSHFGRAAEAEAAYARALRLNPNDRDVRRAAAVFYLKNDRPADARPHVRQALESRDAEDLPLLFLLAGSYQATGDHTEALAALREGAEAFPAAASDAEFQRLTQVSEANLASGKRVRSAALDGLRPGKLRPRPGSSLLPRVLFPALVVLAFAAYVGTAYYKGLHRTVYVVNGLERAYDVNLNGRRVRVPARSHAQVELPEGDVSVALADPALAAALPARTCNVRTSFWGRPFAKDAFVINPDGTAVVYVEEVTYSADSYHPTVAGGANPHRLYVGGLLYAVDKVDYPFTAPPRTIKVSEGSRPIVKRHLEQFTEATPVETVQLVHEELGRAGVAPMLRNAALCNPTDRRYVLMAAALLPPDEALSLLQPRLSVRPVLVEWHRAYQQLTERLHPDHDLAAEYRALLAREPNDTTLLYLLGRVTGDRAEARRLFTRAAEGQPPVAYGYHALAYDALAAGDFAKAVEFARGAQRVAPGTMEDSRAYEADALLALGRYDELLAMVRADAAKAGQPNPELALREVELLASKGDVAGARAAAQNFGQRLTGNRDGGAGARDAGAHWRAHADAAIAYVTGDRAGYVARLRSMPGGPTPAQQFQAALTEGRLDEAAALLDKARPPAPAPASDPESAEPSIVTGEVEVLMYAAAAAAGRADLAEPRLKSAIATYGRGSKEERQVARWLGPDGPRPSPDEAAALAVPWEQKRLVLTALGFRHPDDRASHFANAARFNFSRNFPYQTIKQIIGQDDEGGGAVQNTRSSPRRAATR